jgi:hypothetical protein
MAFVNNCHGLFLVEVVYTLHVGVGWLSIESFDISKPIFHFLNFAGVFLVVIVDVLNVICHGFVDLDCKYFVINFFLVNKTKTTKNEIITNGKDGFGSVRVLTHVD